MTNTPRIRTTTEIADEIVDGLSDPWGSPIAGDVIAGTKKRIEEALDLERKRAEGLVEALEKYGRHANMCGMEEKGHPCICGLDKALSSLPPKSDERVKAMLAVVEAARPIWNESSEGTEKAKSQVIYWKKLQMLGDSIAALDQIGEKS